jgi:hypothetical protein
MVHAKARRRQGKSGKKPLGGAAQSRTLIRSENEYILNRSNTKVTKIGPLRRVKRQTRPQLILGKNGSREVAKAPRRSGRELLRGEAPARSRPRWATVSGRPTRSRFRIGSETRAYAQEPPACGTNLLTTQNSKLGTRSTSHLHYVAKTRHSLMVGRCTLVTWDRI